MSSTRLSVTAKSNLNLSLSRLNQLIKKETVLLQSLRSSIAALLLNPAKHELARVKTEALINRELTNELGEFLELEIELLLARWPIVETSLRDAKPDPQVNNLITTIIHTAPRIPALRELAQFRDLMMNRFGRDYAISCMDDTENLVNKRIKTKLGELQDTPKPELVEGYLEVIAESYGGSYKSTSICNKPGDASPEVSPDDTAKAGETEIASEKDAVYPVENRDPAALSALEQLQNLEIRFAALKKP